MRDVGLLGGQFQAAFVKESSDERFDFVFEQLFGATGYDEVVGKTDEVDFGAGSGTGVFGIAVVQQALQSVEREVGQDG
jgi:hypothetical protein